MAIGIEQSVHHEWDLQSLYNDIVRSVHCFFRNNFESAEAKEAAAIAARVRQDSPTVYVDGFLAPPLEYGNAARNIVQAPASRNYSVTFPAAGLSGDRGRPCA